MGTIRIGAAVAAVAAGPKLWSLVATGSLTSSAAMVRWAAVVAACALGISGIKRIIADYEQQSRAAALAAASVAPSPAAADREVLEGTPIRADDEVTDPLS